MEQLPASADALVSDRVALAFFAAPYWVWLLVGFCLGALTLWTYWRCYVDEARRDPSLIGVWRPLPAPAPAGGADAASGGGSQLSPTPLVGDPSIERRDPPLEEPAERAEAPRGDGAALRYRAWALETRLRQALDAASENAPLDVAGLRQGLEDVFIAGVAPGEDGAPPEEISILKHRIWRLEGALAREGGALAAIDPPPPPPPSAPLAPPAPVEDALAARRVEMAERLLIAARLGDWRLVRRVERELADGADDEPPFDETAALLARIEELEADRASLADQAAGLRYRRWLLSRRLGDAVETARLDQDLAVDRLMTDLARDGETPRFGESGANFFMTARKAPPASLAPLAPPADRLRELEALRRRGDALETALRRERAAPKSAPVEEANARAAAAAYRLWLAQAELRRGVAAGPIAQSAEAAAEAEALRARLVELETALKSARADAETEMSTLRQRTEALETEREAAQLRAETAERHLAEAAAPAAAALQSEAAAAQAALSGARQELIDARAEAEDLRRALAASQTALAERGADANRLAALEAEALELRRGVQANTQLGAELETLRARLRLYERAAEPLAPTPPPIAPPPIAPPSRSPSVAVSDLRWTDAATLAVLRSALAPTIDSPRRGVEAAALELIESGRVVALESNRPANLRDVAFPGEPDDLGVLAGATPALRAEMNRAGLFSFRQFAEFGAYDLAWLDDRLSLSGGVVRERWAPQAEQLAAWRREGLLSYDDGGETLWRGGGASLEAPAPALLDAALLRAIAAEAERAAAAPGAAEWLSAPQTGAEAAALELLQRPETAQEAARLPSSFSREPFEPGDALDHLQAIRGVGPATERALRQLGVGRYRQIAALSPEEAAWLDRRLGLGGGALRQRWLPQAQSLVRRGALSGETLRREPAPRATPRPAPSAASIGLNRDGAPEEAEAARLIAQGLSSGAFDERPASARAAPEDEGDDLKAIKGVGAKQEAQLNALGFHSFAQLAGFGPRELAWLDAALGLRGRVVAEGWMRQARRLAERKAAGELRLGPEGAWTLPDPSSDRVAALEAARRSPLSVVEREAMRVIDARPLGERAAIERRPEGLLPGPSGASPDALDEIQGVNAALAELLNGVGVYYFSQLAAFDAGDLAWLDAQLGANGRVIRDRWAAQAEALERLKRAGVA